MCRQEKERENRAQERPRPTARGTTTVVNGKGGATTQQIERNRCAARRRLHNRYRLGQPIKKPVALFLKVERVGAASTPRSGSIIAM
jgi:hypothetical protein